MRSSYRSRTAMLLATLVVAGCAPAEKQAAAGTADVVVEAKDFAFSGPSQVTAGRVHWVLKNHGPTIHHAQMVRVDSGHAAADLVDAIKSANGLPAWAHPVGGPNAAEPGSETRVSMDMTPGDYALVCLVDLPEHVMHAAMGMAHSFKVVAATAGAAPATAGDSADMTVTLRDFAFEAPDSLRAGAHRIAVKVDAAQPHELALFKLKPGKSMDDFMKWGATYEGMAPATAEGGVAANDPGRSSLLEVTLTPGTYVMLCFVPDAVDHKPHMMKGMMKLVKVT